MKIINIKLTECQHMALKRECAIKGISMQEKAVELLTEWAEQQEWARDMKKKEEREEAAQLLLY